MYVQFTRHQFKCKLPYTYAYEQATGAGCPGFYPDSGKGKWRVKQGILMTAFLGILKINVHCTFMPY
jgi:hypothetical protein